MKDRISTDPGRVLVVPEGSEMQSYYATLYRADNPTQEGTPLNAATFLKDATAALCGLGTDAVPDDAIAALKGLVDAAQGAADTKAQVVTGSYVGTGTSGQSNPITLTVGATPKLLAVSGRMSNATGTTVAVSGSTLVQGSSSQSGFSNFTLTWSSNGVSWYSSGASEQMNISGEVYYYTIVC